MDLHDQYVYMEKTGQWRFTPPTHVVVALHEAIAQFEAEGGQPAQLARYTRNYQTLMTGMARLGFKPFLDPAIQAPIIVTFHAPAHPNYDFKSFYAAVRAAWLFALSGQTHPDRDLSGRLHWCHRPA
jgi:2-aminoethylphosphonate-pyruvate transaminase